MTKRLLLQIMKWNQKYAIGAPVAYRKDNRTLVITTTRSKAEILSSHTAVVWLTDVSGCVALERVGAIVPLAKAISIGAKYEPAMSITEQAAADAWFERCVEHTLTLGVLDRAEAEILERANLGYWAGYYGNEVRERVERLFNCAHPVFGRIAEVGPPAPAEALAAGLVRGLAVAGCS